MQRLFGAAFRACHQAGGRCAASTPPADHGAKAERPPLQIRGEAVGNTRNDMREHWLSGLEDAGWLLKRRDWLALPEEGLGTVVHEVHRERDY